MASPTSNSPPLNSSTLTPTPTPIPTPPSTNTTTTTTTTTTPPTSSPLVSSHVTSSILSSLCNGFLLLIELSFTLFILTVLFSIITLAQLIVFCFQTLWSILPFSNSPLWLTCKQSIPDWFLLMVKDYWQTWKSQGVPFLLNVVHSFRNRMTSLFLKPTLPSSLSSTTTATATTTTLMTKEDPTYQRPSTLPSFANDNHHSNEVNHKPYGLNETKTSDGSKQMDQETKATLISLKYSKIKET